MIVWYICCSWSYCSCGSNGVYHFACGDVRQPFGDGFAAASKRARSAADGALKTHSS